LGSEKDWKCPQLVTVVLQPKNEVASVVGPEYYDKYPPVAERVYMSMG